MHAAVADRAVPVLLFKSGADNAYKWLTDDARPVLERASARETCARVAAAAVVRQLLARSGVEVRAFVESIGDVASRFDAESPLSALVRARARSAVACPDAAASKRMVEAIRVAGRAGDTLGGTFVVVAAGLPPGLGSCAQWDERLDGRIAQAVMSIPAVKGVEIGIGFAAAARPGSRVHDDVRWRRSVGRHGGIARGSNRAGGLEGGITNGERLVVRAAMKPISTLRKPLRSVDLHRRTTAAAAFERSDVCAVAAASVVGEAMVLLTVGREYRQVRRRFTGARRPSPGLRAGAPAPIRTVRSQGVLREASLTSPGGALRSRASPNGLNSGAHDPRESSSGRTSGESDPGANSLLA
jgi:chorismate synthase